MSASHISPLLADLNPIQTQAVLATDGPVLVLAGAGSGKTKVLTHRVAYLIQEKKVPADSILVVTFTNKAAGEMTNRIKKLLNQLPAATYQLPVMGTFHSICARILRRDGVNIGLTPGFAIYDETDAVEAIKQAMEKLVLTDKKMSPSAVKHTISSAKNEMVSSLEYPRFARGYFQETVAKIYLEYQKILETNQALDFDDLLLLTVKLFQHSPQTLAYYQIKFKYILIDEYQDTNAVQYALTKLLSAQHKNICVVGDASQAIYGFRGADFRNIVNFQADYPNTRVFNLEQNYRSTQIILDAARAVISKNTSHPVLSLWTDNLVGQKIKITEARNEKEEAEIVISEIKKSSELRIKNSELKLLTPNSDIRTLNSYAVLYRTNAQSRALEEAFLKNSLPYILVGGIRFYERREIKDVLAYLRLVQNPKDSVALKRAEKLGKGRLNKFFEVSVTIDKSTTLDTLDLILQKTDYLDTLEDGTDQGKYRIENVKELRSVAEQFPNLTEFLENVALVEHIGAESDQNSDKVTLTTLHQAKGLEWSVVFMVGMEEGLFPHSRSFLNPAELEEERRLCYVGITRAKERLYLTHTRQRLFFGTRSNNLVSRFISDIPQELVQSQMNYINPDQFLDDVSIQKDEDDWLNL